jgi:hypothetical protein
MAKKKKVIQVDAIQWNTLGDHPLVVQFTGITGTCPVCSLDYAAHGSLLGQKFMAGFITDQRVCPGDYIVQDSDDVYDVCNTVKYNKNYE